MRLTAKTCSML